MITRKGDTLNRATLARGFTPIELMVTLAVCGIVLARGAPRLLGVDSEHPDSDRAAESMLTGIKLARAEAAKRNATVSFPG